jgi:ketosteroid isomerase-like protein
MNSMKALVAQGKMIGPVTGILLAMVIPSANATSTINNPADIKAITALETDLNTQTNMKSLIKYYAPDAVVLDIFAPGLYKGRTQIYEFFQQQLNAVQSMKHTMPEINIASDGTMACAAMQFHFDSTMKNGKIYTLSVRQIDAFKKIDGRWKIIQEHISVPADPKTGMAVIDAAIQVGTPVSWDSALISGPAVSPAQARAEIRKWMEQGALATNADELMQYYGPGDNVLVYDSFTPGDLRGKQEIRNYYGPLVESYTNVDLKMPEFSAASDGTFGAQINTQDMVLTMKDGSKKNLSLRQSDCMHRVDGKWYSFFEMISFPVDPKTGKAVMRNPEAFK